MSQENVEGRFVTLVHRELQTFPQSAGLFPIASGLQIPPNWEPEPSVYDPKAIPTPFARGETMQLLLAALGSLKPDDANYDYIRHFRLLLLGIAAGVLELEPDDLSRPTYDNLGQALLQVESEARYFAHVRRPGNPATSFGVTHRGGLFSPHARRSDGDWNKLSEAIRPMETQAVTLLADWRQCLTNAGRWQSSLPNCEWQRGVNQILDEVKAVPSPQLRELHDNSHWVGPVMLCLPTGLTASPVALEPVYLPSVRPAFAARFQSICQFRPTRDKDSIVFRDAVDRIVATIAMPESGQGTDPVAVGMGALDFRDVPRQEGVNQELKLLSRPGEPGLIDLLDPLVMALRRLAEPREIAAVRVDAAPFLYPDPIRILCHLGRWPSADGARVVMSPNLDRALIALGGPMPSAEETAAMGGEVVLLGGTALPVNLRLFDRVRDTPVNDLRALGFALWKVFVGEAELKEGHLHDSDQAWLLLDPSDERPLIPSAEIYKLVDGPPVESLRRRLATMQRFVKAYPLANSGLARVLSRAARSFVEWASGRSDVAPLGRHLGRTLLLRLATGEDVPFQLDAIGQPANSPGQN